MAETAEHRTAACFRREAEEKHIARNKIQIEVSTLEHMLRIAYHKQMIGGA